MVVFDRYHMHPFLATFPFFLRKSDKNVFCSLRDKQFFMIIFYHLPLVSIQRA